MNLHIVLVGSPGGSEIATNLVRQLPGMVQGRAESINAVTVSVRRRCDCKNGAIGPRHGASSERYKHVAL